MANFHALHGPKDGPLRIRQRSDSAFDDRLVGHQPVIEFLVPQSLLNIGVKSRTAPQAGVTSPSRDMMVKDSRNTTVVTMVQ